MPSGRSTAMLSTVACGVEAVNEDSGVAAPVFDSKSAVDSVFLVEVGWGRGVAVGIATCSVRKVSTTTAISAARSSRVITAPVMRKIVDCI